MDSNKQKVIKDKIKDIKRFIKLKRAEIKSQTKEEQKKQKEQEYMEFDSIYKEYGQLAYKKYVPRKYQKKDIINLLNESRFLELYTKYGESVFRKYMDGIKKIDIEYEAGNKLKAKFYQLKYDLRHCYIPAIIMSQLATPSLLAVPHSIIRHNDRIKYAEEIEEYIDDVNTYAEEVKSYNLTDLQNIMLVMDDMWKEIDGYGIPQIDTYACLGLDMSEKYGVGVCRNMADDFSRKLNAINPEYNARPMVVNLSKNGEYQCANIERHYASEQKLEEQQELQNEVNSESQQKETQNYEINETQSTNSLSKENPTTTQAEKQNEKQSDVPQRQEQSNAPQVQEQDKESIKEHLQDFANLIGGNHAVTLINIPGKQIKLIVDPTNTGIGVFQNGKITLFNSQKNNPKHERINILGEAKVRGVTSLLEVPYTYISSIGFNDLDDLEKAFGLDAQNKALEEVRSLRKRTFRESIRYDINTATITQGSKNIKDNTKEKYNKINEER